MTQGSAYAALKAYRTRIHNLEHLQAIASWDRLTHMPAGGAPARAAAQGELAALLQRMQADPEVGELLVQAGHEALGPNDATNLALMRRERVIAQALPEQLVQRRAECVRAASQAWQAARSSNDWGLFAAALAPLLDCVQEQAARIGDGLGISPYDALLDGYDRGLRADRVTALFSGVATWLPGIIAASIECQTQSDVLTPVGPFDPARQRDVGIAVMTLLGFDFSAGRLDVSAHPFTGGVPEDVRLTTRYREDDCLSALLGIIHETGHGRYQSGLPRAWLGQPLGEPCSAAMHEAQALAFERQLAPTPAFAARLSPLLTDAFGAQPAFAPDNLLRLMTRVRPGPIRVEADELTYPAHVILRVEIEAALIDGTIAVDDVPAWWDERMARLLGIDTRGDFTRGPLQDIHWSQGMFGYFPAYLFGAMIAAQLVERFRQDVPDFGGDAARTDFAQFGDWLEAQVWSRGAALTTDALVEAVTGRPLSDDALRAHFERRYLS